MKADAKIVERLVFLDVAAGSVVLLKAVLSDALRSVGLTKVL